MARNIKGSSDPSKVVEAMGTFHIIFRILCFYFSHILFRFISQLLGIFIVFHSILI